MHSNTLRITRITLDEISVAESEWASETCSDDSFFVSDNDSQAADLFPLTDVTKLVNQNHELAESDLLSSSSYLDDQSDTVPFSFNDRKMPGVLVAR